MTTTPGPDPRSFHATDLANRVVDIATCYGQLHRALLALAADVDSIGKPRGLGVRHAHDVVQDVLRAIRHTEANVSLAGLVQAAADYDRTVSTAGSGVGRVEAEPGAGQ